MPDIPWQIPMVGPPVSEMMEKEKMGRGREGEGEGEHGGGDFDWDVKEINKRSQLHPLSRYPSVERLLGSII